MVSTSLQQKQTNQNHMLRNKEVIKTDHLNSEEWDSLWNICREFANIFHLEGNPFPAKTAIQHEIRLKEDTKFINIRPYRLPYTHRHEVILQTEQLERHHIIQPSESSRNALLIVILKKADAQENPQYRVFVDFRRLNQLTIGDTCPIPRIDEILDQLGR